MCRKLSCRAVSRTCIWWVAILGPATGSHLEDGPLFCMQVHIKMANSSSFAELLLFEPLWETMTIAIPLSLNSVSSRCSCLCPCMPSPIRVWLCSSFPFSPGSGFHLALSQHRYWSGSFNFQAEGLWWAGAEAAGGNGTSWAQAGSRQWACI